MIQENRLIINLFRSESQISIFYHEFVILNCKSNQDNEKSLKGSGQAKTLLKLPMWLIYSCSFIVESLYNCLYKEKNITRLCGKYMQIGNEVIFNINQSDL